MSSPLVSPDLRCDAARNRDAVMEAAIRLLGEQPNASIQAIADAAGVGRATVYRRFPTREVLQDELLAHARQEVDDTFLPMLAGRRSVADTLTLIVAEAVRMGVRYRFLHQRQDIAERHSGELEREMLAWLERGRRSGEVRADVPAGWLFRMLEAVTLSAIDALASGELTAPEAVDLAERSLRSMLLAQRRRVRRST